MTIADLAINGSTGLEQAVEPRRRSRRGRRVLFLVALAGVIGLVAARKRHHIQEVTEDSNGF